MQIPAFVKGKSSSEAGYFSRQSKIKFHPARLAARLSGQLSGGGLPGVLAHNL
jgi:hypothetical protein